MAVNLKGIKGTVSGAAAKLSDDVLLGDGKPLTDIGDVLGTVSLDYKVASVTDMNVNLLDDGSLKKADLLKPEMTLQYKAERYEIAAVERDYRGKSIAVVLTARSRLARQIRKNVGPHTAKDVTPSEFLASSVKKLGGVAHVELGARRRNIVQKRGQSLLAVIQAIALDTGVEWVEHSNTLWVGTPWWAYKNLLPGMQEWGLKLGTKNDCNLYGLNSRESLDDRTSAADATAVVSYELGKRIRPWHHVIIDGATKSDNGVWLVTAVPFDNMRGQVSLSLQRPLKSAPKKGSAGKDKNDGGLSSADVDADLGGKWIDGADKRWPGCSRTPREIIRWAMSQNNTGYQAGRCLQWASIAARGSQGLGGYYAKYAWKYAPASTPKSSKDFDPPIGAMVVWGPPTGGAAGHIGYSVGGGKFISATIGKVQILSIRGYGTGGDASYLGAMPPNFGGNYPTHPNG